MYESYVCENMPTEVPVWRAIAFYIHISVGKLELFNWFVVVRLYSLVNMFLDDEHGVSAL